MIPGDEDGSVAALGLEEQGDEDPRDVRTIGAACRPVTDPWHRARGRLDIRCTRGVPAEVTCTPGGIGVPVPKVEETCGGNTVTPCGLQDPTSGYLPYGGVPSSIECRTRFRLGDTLLTLSLPVLRQGSWPGGETWHADVGGAGAGA